MKLKSIFLSTLQQSWLGYCCVAQGHACQCVYAEQFLVVEMKLNSSHHHILLTPSPFDFVAGGRRCNEHLGGCYRSSCVWHVTHVCCKDCVSLGDVELARKKIGVRSIFVGG